MNPTLQRDIINFLRPLPQFESENSRKALLITAGLNNIISSLDLRGSAGEFVPLLVRRLEAFGVAADDEPALVVLLRSLARDMGQEKKAAIREFCARLLDDEPARLMARCPYRGLSAFREEDEQFFFGRDSYTRKLVDLVQANSFVAVLGASGSGKSSLVYAGLIPQLPRQIPSWEGQGVGKWRIISFRPGEHPLHALSKALIPCLYSDELEQIGKIKQLTSPLGMGGGGVLADTWKLFFTFYLLAESGATYFDYTDSELECEFSVVDMWGNNMAKPERLFAVGDAVL
ncbi:All0665 protein [Candidatus Moduliflexus flocculans]|uniref:All0665 protein n=1 Tax=Candidatus Moduliflexus flocculans TaxID=1499966 RepID=A0A0S6VU15_9BACT|nr:All0665 protein [Candidatus Moduliflexus flocculans]